RLVDTLGIPFVHRLIRDSGRAGWEVMRASLIALELLAAEEYVSAVNDLDNAVPADVQYALMERLADGVEALVYLLLGDASDSSTAGELLSKQQAPVDELLSGIPNLLPQVVQDSFKSEVERFEEDQVPHELAETAARFAQLPGSIGAIETAERGGCS